MDGSAQRLRRPGLLGVALDPLATRIESAMEVARTAEEHRADFVSVPDHPYMAGELDTWVLLTAVAARTERIAVASNVTSLPLRPPVMLAKAVASLQVLSEGRAVLGVGAGVPETTSFGGPPWNIATARPALDEAIRLIRALWASSSDGPPSFDGEYHRAPESPFGPTVSPSPPIWVGAFGPRMLALTGRLGDGWLPTNAFLDLTEVRGMQQRIDRSAERAGRDPSTIRRILNVIGKLTDTGGPGDGRQLVGPASRWVDALGEYHDRLGFDSFTFWPVGRDRATQVSRFFTEVRPQIADIFQPDVSGSAEVR